MFPFDDVTMTQPLVYLTVARLLGVISHIVWLDVIQILFGKKTDDLHYSEHKLFGYGWSLIRVNINAACYSIDSYIKMVCSFYSYNLKYFHSGELWYL